MTRKFLNRLTSNHKFDVIKLAEIWFFLVNYCILYSTVHDRGWNQNIINHIRMGICRANTKAAFDEESPNGTRRVMGLNNIVEESHLPKLPYMNAIVKEALHLHPAAPLLAPRCSSAACVVGGYSIPPGTMILINALAIQRGPKNWDEPLEFRPERFVNSNRDCDYSGTNFQYIPFGSGIRVCVGIPLAERLIPYLLATLLHSFDWKLQDGAKLDMSEAFGLELVKKESLVVVPIKR